MRRTIRIDLDRTGARGLAACLACVTFLVTGACVTPTTYSSVDSSIVSEGRAMRDLGIDYLSGGRTALAIRHLTKSLDLDPTDPMTHTWLGEAYRRKGRSAKAEGFFSEALEIAQATDDDQAEQEARLGLSALLSQMGRYEDSLEHCEVLSDDPTYSTPWRPLSNCGWSMMKLGRNAEAREYFEDALDFFPRFAPALLNLGILEAEEGHRLVAIKLLDKALDSGRLNGSGHAEANYRLGEIYVALGRRDKAVEHFGLATKIAPDGDWGSQSQAYLDLLR